MTHYSSWLRKHINTKKQTCPGEYSSKASHSPTQDEAWVIGESLGRSKSRKLGTCWRVGQSSYSWEAWRPGRSRAVSLWKVSGRVLWSSVMGRECLPGGEGVSRLWNSERGHPNCWLAAQFTACQPGWVARREINRNSRKKILIGCCPSPLSEPWEGASTMISQRMAWARLHTAEWKCRRVETGLWSVLGCNFGFW